jgi:hypothetical protein
MFDNRAEPVDRTFVRTGITLATEYFSELGLQVPSVTVYAYKHLAGISPDWEAIAAATGLTSDELLARRGRYVGQAYPSTIFIAVGLPAWQAQPAVHQIRLVAHEYFHHLQFWLVGPEASRSFFEAPVGTLTKLGPNWLLEGSAEYFSWRVMQDAGLVGLADYLLRLDMKDDVDPADLETYLDFFATGQASYDASLRAVAFLLAGDEKGASLIRYFFEIGQGMPWQAAFLASFGQTVESFYKNYGAYIASR